MAIRKIIAIGVEARNKLTKGAQILAEAVSSTLGPYGANFFLEKGHRPTNDGVKIAREMSLTDEVENLGMFALREAAIKTNDEVGDGTTTAITLAWSIYKEASRFLSKDGVVGKKTPAELVKQIEKERKEITEKLKEQSVTITTKEELINSARVAVEDRDLGDLIGSAQWELGKDGLLLAEETAERESSVERVKGIRIDNGFGTSQLVNNVEKQTLEVDDTKILLTTITIKDIVNDWQKVGRLVESAAKSGSSRVTIIARAWSDDTIRACLENINKGAVKIYPISAPYTDMQERMKDLQAVLGGEFYDSENSTLDDLRVDGLGQAQKVVARRYDAIFTGKNDVLTQARIQKRVAELKEKLTGSASEFEKKSIQERIAQLENGFSLVKVGSPSDMERKRLYDKAEDAVNAVRAAFQEGTVKGAGLAFKEISESLPDDYLLKRPLLSIYEQIKSSAPSDFVIEDWVRDPAMVLRVALEKACAAAASFATAGGAIVQEEPKPLDMLLKNNVNLKD